MSLDNCGSVWTLDQCYPLSKTNLSNVNEMNKLTYWINSRPRFIKKFSSKGFKLIIDYICSKKSKQNTF